MSADPLADLLQRDAAGEEEDRPWEVRSGPAGLTVMCWTKGTFPDREAAQAAAHDLATSIQELGFSQSGVLEVGARSKPDQDWRGTLLLRLARD